MKRGDILLFRNKKLISRLIRWFTKSPYSHAAVAIDFMHVYETNYNTKSQIKHLNSPRNRYDIYRLKPGIEYDEEKFIKFIEDHLDNAYDYGEILKVMFGINTPDDDGKYICSMLVREAFLEQGIDLTPGIEIPTPEDLSHSELLYKVEE